MQRIPSQIFLLGFLQNAVNSFRDIYGEPFAKQFGFTRQGEDINVVFFSSHIECNYTAHGHLFSKDCKIISEKAIKIPYPKAPDLRDSVNN